MVMGNLINKILLFTALVIICAAAITQGVSSQEDFAGSGDLQVESSPKGAQVFIDNVLKGTTPLSIKGLRPGSYLVKLIYGSLSQEISVIINPDKTALVSWDLQGKTKIGLWQEFSSFDNDLLRVLASPLELRFPSFVEAVFIESRASRVQLAKQKGLKGILHLKFSLDKRLSHRDIQVTLLADYYEIDTEKKLLDKRYAAGREYNFDPGGQQVLELKQQALQELEKDLRQLLTETYGGDSSLSPEKPEAKFEETPIDASPEKTIISGAGSWTEPDYTGTGFAKLIGVSPPDFALRTRRGENIELSSYKGRGVVLLYFFDASFQFCRRELDEIHRLYLRNQDEFTPIGISIAGSGRRRLLTENFLRTRLYEFPVVIDTAQVSRKYSASDSVPVWVLIDKKGKIRYIKRGTWKVESVYERIRYLYMEE